MGRFSGALQRVAAKPSRPIAAGLAVGGLAYLLFTPLSDGDSWIARLFSGMSAIADGSAKTNPSAIIAQDTAGNNVFSIAGQQFAANVWGALPLLGGAAVVAWLGRKFKF